MFLVQKMDTKNTKNLGLSHPLPNLGLFLKFYRFFIASLTTYFRKDAESLNATSLAVIAGMDQNWDNIWNVFSPQVRVAAVSSYFSSSTSGSFSCLLYLQDAFIFASTTLLFELFHLLVKRKEPYAAQKGLPAKKVRCS